MKKHKKKIKLIIFGYEFPHYKTENGLRELIVNGYEISLVILQKYKKLSVPNSKNNVYVKFNPTGNIKELCKQIKGIASVQAPHWKWVNLMFKATHRKLEYTA